MVKRLEAHSHESAIAAPVWYELIHGCRRLANGKRRNAIEHYLHDVVQASFPSRPEVERGVAPAERTSRNRITELPHLLRSGQGPDRGERACPAKARALCALRDSARIRRVVRGLQKWSGPRNVGTFT